MNKTFRIETYLIWYHKYIEHDKKEINYIPKLDYFRKWHKNW